MKMKKTGDSKRGIQLASMVVLAVGTVGVARPELNLILARPSYNDK
jgi:hypothetical protein